MGFELSELNEITRFSCFGGRVELGCGYMKRIQHCKKCKDGRLIALKPRGLMFCGFCGAEVNVKI